MREIRLKRSLQNGLNFSKRSLKEQNLAVLEAANFADGLIQTSLNEMPLLKIFMFNSIDRVGPVFLFGFYGAILFILGVIFFNLKIFILTGGFIVIFFILLWAIFIYSRFK